MTNQRNSVLEHLLFAAMDHLELHQGASKVYNWIMFTQRANWEREGVVYAFCFYTGIRVFQDKQI